MKTALIFGAAGFVGRYLSGELKQQGYYIVGSDVLKPDHPSGCDEFAVCDLLNAERVFDLIDRYHPSAIINLAAISSVGQSWKIPQKTMEVNVNGGLNILEAARCAAPEASLLFVGSSEEYAVCDTPISERVPLNANNPYGISKLALEQFSEVYRIRYGMKIHHVRSFNHTGVGQRETFVIPGWCRQAAEITKSGTSGEMRVGNTSVIRDFGNVRDVVRAYRLVLESEDCSLIYNIGTGEGFCLSDLLEYLCSLSPQTITVKQDPDLFRPADNPVIVCDHSLITKKLGWKPEYSIYQTVKEIYDYYLEDKT